MTHIGSDHKLLSIYDVALVAWRLLNNILYIIHSDKIRI